MPSHLIMPPVRLAPSQDSPCQGNDTALIRRCHGVPAWHKPTTASGMTIGLWFYTDAPVVQEQARLGVLGTFHAYGAEGPP